MQDWGETREGQLMNRIPLPPGSRIEINGRTYIIRDKIAEGGFSLIYDAVTINSDKTTTSYVVKEFYPMKNACRDSQGRVCATGDCAAFDTNYKRFRNEGELGRLIAARTHQAYAVLEADAGYAVMQRYSEDICSISGLEEGWNTARLIPFTGNIDDLDPCFPDNVRVKYALTVVERLLDVVSVIHGMGYLHLDISAENVIIAEKDHSSGRNGTVMLADYGCAVQMTDDRFVPTEPMSYSELFAAPEILERDGALDPRTDIYAVGMLLSYLCMGRRYFYIMDGYTVHEKKYHIHDMICCLEATDVIKERLLAILDRAVCRQSLRYSSAVEMQNDIREMANDIPVHPVNPDNTRAFTLYSLKSMLIGSLDTRYSWADELRDRRHADYISFPDSVYTGISWKIFNDDNQFIRFVLPEAYYDYLRSKIEAQSDRKRAMFRILTCNYDSAWKNELCGIISSYGTRRLLEISRTLLNNEAAFLDQRSVLFRLLGDDGERLRQCYFNCGSVIQRAPYVGLAMLTLYALLGPDGFERLMPSPGEAGRYFYAL